MSKYEHFVNMKTHVILIILGSIQLVFTCNHDLNTTDDLYPVCPVSLFRRKRAYPNYARWRSNDDDPGEFLVKVFDEELTTKPVVAVNVITPTKGGNKLIIGAPSPPSATMLLPTADEPREYTRFVPPTTIGKLRDDSLYNVPPNIPPNIPPIKATSTKNPILQPVPGIPKEAEARRNYYNLQRDDSPPASPQFIARTPGLVARQYAPITAVAFTQRPSFPPVTPPFAQAFSKYTTHSTPSRTSSKTIPTRTNYRHFEEENLKPTITDTYAYPERTTASELETTTNFEFSKVSTFDMDNNNENVPTTIKLIEEIKRRQEELKKIADKETMYNMMFYDDEEPSSNKKEDQDGIDGEDDKKESEDSVLETDDSGSNSTETNPPDEITDENMRQTDGDHLDDKNSSLPDNDTTSRSSGKSPDLASFTTKKDIENPRDKHRPLCSLIKLRQLNFNSPRTLPEIVNQLRIWAEDSPVAKWKDITYGNFTVMENPIYMVIVDDPSSGQVSSAKQTVMIVAGIQGRDHHAVAAAMYVLYQLIERTESHSDLLTKYRFWVIPVFNPDGYDYSMTFPHRREWTKNLRQQWDVCQGRESCSLCETHGVRCTIQPCYGVNLDRNFEYQWISASERNTEHPCGRLYAGLRQLSEIETRSLTQFLGDQNSQIGTFIAFKEGDVLGVMYPYSHTKKKRSLDQAYRQRASRAAAAAFSIGNRPYVAGQTSEFLPLYAGGIEDWVDGHLGIDNTYTIMMFRPSESYNVKLITERVVHEAYAAMDTLLMQSLEPLSPGPPAKLTRRGGHGERIHSNGLLCISAIYFILLLNG